MCLVFARLGLRRRGQGSCPRHPFPFVSRSCCPCRGSVSGPMLRGGSRGLQPFSVTTCFSFPLQRTETRVRVCECARLCLPKKLSTNSCPQAQEFLPAKIQEQKQLQKGLWAETSALLPGSDNTWPARPVSGQQSASREEELKAGGAPSERPHPTQRRAGVKRPRVLSDWLPVTQAQLQGQSQTPPLPSEGTQGRMAASGPPG